ncbi:rhamnulokinase family protein [Bacteroides sp. 224]|uniref:rhamnulokinase n=1 Tax=Bacteroides sp. 224 TaxID=2302936 RepID=UPI0013D5D2C6|nr:rhamnulokinase family protein [Bacteroides sp. 224]NDV64103.1 rhamnulokinase [Bacteroides sp. 224]
MKNVYLAVDFGGGSGRVMAGSIAGDRLMLEEIYRFPNRQIKLGYHIYWDFLALFEEMKTGLKKAVQAGYKIEGIAVDTWGVDFGFIDKDGNLVGNPVCYRDPRTDGLPDEVFTLINETAHYADTGIQVMPINTLFQLYSLKKANSKQLDIADKLLFMPDLFSYFLTEEATNEYCIASTSEMLNACEGEWSYKLIEQLGLPASIFGKIIKPGTIRGQLKKEVAEEIGLNYPVDVIAVGSHDTASAVIAVPSLTKDAAFLSSGTWSLLGIEVDEPILTEEARLGGFTNEGGVNGKIRFLQNITGLWILQRLMAEWKARGVECDFDSLIEAAIQSPCRTIIPVDDVSFQNPSSMEEAVVRYCEAHNLYVPQTPGEFMRCVTESLAYRYKQGVDQMNKCLPAPIKQLHIIGGGCQNKLLNQLTANYLGIPVQAGPVEATAMGNILVQALAKKEIFSVRELKDIVINSVILQTYYPSS